MSYIGGVLANITIRGCDEELSRRLKAAGKRRGVSVNRLVLETLSDSFLGPGKKPREYDDLDALAGTWSAEEAGEFDAAVSAFNEVDEGLWAP